MAEVVFVKRPNGTSLLTVNLNVISAKCMKVLSASPGEWIENLVISRCQPTIESRWQEHVKECIKQNITPRTRNMLIVGFEPPPDVIFETRTINTENDDGSLEIEVEIDATYTACIESVFLNPVEEIKRVISSRIDKEIDLIIDKAVTNGTYTGKTRDQIILSHEPEQPEDPDLDDPTT